MSVTGHDSLKARRSLDVDGKRYDYFSLDVAASAAGLGDVSRLPFSLKVLLENPPLREAIADALQHNYVNSQQQRLPPLLEKLRKPWNPNPS